MFINFIKKLFLVFIIFFNIFIFSESVFAESWDTTSETTVVVSEKLPWMKDCTELVWWWPEVRKYECKVKWWFASVMEMLKWFIKYAVLIWIMFSVLMLVISWIRMSIDWKKDEAKKLFTRVVVALVVLFMMWFILATVAPWVYE